MSVPESGNHRFCICSCGCNRLVSRTTVWRHQNRRRSLLVQPESPPRPRQRRVAHFQAESPIITHDKQKRSRTNNISSTSHSRVDASDHPRISTVQLRAPLLDEFKPSPPLLNPPPASNLLQPPWDAVEDDQDLISAATDTVATLPTPEDVRHAKNTILRGEYFDFVCASYQFFLFLFSSACCVGTQTQGCGRGSRWLQHGARSGGMPEESREPSSGDVS
jgi:hypothetical protein